MNIRKILFSVCLAGIANFCYGQEKTQIEKDNGSAKEIRNSNKYNRLKIGDKVPEDFVFENMVNYPGGKARMADFKGKVLILDFWNIACSPCIAAFPKMEKFQAKYGDRLQILLVNIFNSLNSLERDGFPNQTVSPIIPLIKLPFVINTKDITEKDIRLGNMDLWELFPHAAEPYHAWIDADGIFRGETRGADVTEKNIEYFFANNRVISARPLLMPEDIGITEENKHQSFLQPRNRYVGENLLYSSVITSGFEIGKGVGNYLLDSATGKQIGKRTDPRGIIDLYIKIAFFKTLPENDKKKVSSLLLFNQLFLDVATPANYISPNNADEYRLWKANNIYIYELRLPVAMVGDTDKETELKINRFMRQDLERYFGIHAFIGKRRVKCWVLSRVSEIDKVATKMGKTIIEKTNSGGLVLNNCSLRTFVESFISANNDQIPIVPFVNETGFDPNTKMIDLAFKNSLRNIEEVRNVLKKHDLTLSLEEREIEVLVINDKV